ncbi:hypothetical protein JTE90_010373 [Oedothorax gibbosus]|uniref:Uncharacterized protein n=1 Tax=Oedothorax gibbosus TaxID=931172 RepID=A0AAV6VYA5_9ARAC|nr:hypothetical protein JTE90_010373 [Oedothorax gibbosus]
MTVVNYSCHAMCPPAPCPTCHVTLDLCGSATTISLIQKQRNCLVTTAVLCHYSVRKQNVPDYSIKSVFAVNTV